MEVIVADITTTRARLVFSFIPALPFVINAWVSGDITSAVLGVTTWNWGVGMFAIIYPGMGSEKGCPRLMFTYEQFAHFLCSPPYGLSPEEQRKLERSNPTSHHIRCSELGAWHRVYSGSLM